MNKTFAIKVGASVLILVAAGIWGQWDNLTAGSVELDTPTASSTTAIPAGTPAAVTQSLTPENAKIVQSVADLSAQIVNNAFNDERTEALVATASAVSLRVNTLKADSMTQAEKTAVAAYNKALAEAKLKLVGEEARASLPKDEEKTQPQQVMQPYSMPLQRDENKPAEKKSDDFESAQLKAIMATNDLDGYKAILSIAGQERSARDGQHLTDNIQVRSISRNNVVLSNGDKTRTLYLP